MLNQEEDRCVKKGNSFIIEVKVDNSGKSEDKIYRIKEVGKLSSFDNRNSNNELNQQIIDDQATKYGNINSENLQSGIKKIAAQEDLES